MNAPLLVCEKNVAILEGMIERGTLRICGGRFSDVLPGIHPRDLFCLPHRTKARDLNDLRAAAASAAASNSRVAWQREAAEAAEADNAFLDIVEGYLSEFEVEVTRGRLTAFGCPVFQPEVICIHDEAARLMFRLRFA